MARSVTSCAAAACATSSAPAMDTIKILRMWIPVRPRPTDDSGADCGRQALRAVDLAVRPDDDWRSSRASTMSITLPIRLTIMVAAISVALAPSGARAQNANAVSVAYVGTASDI